MSAAERNRRYRARHPERVGTPEDRARTLRSYVKQLERGEPITDLSSHHRAMRAIKGPRPEGMQLSLVNWDSPDAYWGRGYYGKPYRLSTNPKGYAWETRAKNTERRDA